MWIKWLSACRKRVIFTSWKQCEQTKTVPNSCDEILWEKKKKKKKPFKCWRMDSWYEKSEWWMFPQRRQCREMSLHCNAGCTKTKSWMTVSSTWFFTKCKCALTFQVRRSETRVYLVTNSERGSLSQYKSQFHQLLPEQQSNPLLI